MLDVLGFAGVCCIIGSVILVVVSIAMCQPDIYGERDDSSEVESKPKVIKEKNSVRCKMHDLVFILRIQNKHNVFFDDLIFKHKGEQHKVGMSLDKKTASGKPSYVLDDDYYPTFDFMVDATILSRSEDRVELLGCTVTGEAGSVPPYRIDLSIPEVFGGAERNVEKEIVYYLKSRGIDLNMEV